jgi:GT2 family glycosyltransferase
MPLPEVATGADRAASGVAEDLRVADLPTLSVVVPTYRREAVLVDTVQALLRQSAVPEIVVVDQTERHEQETQRQLEQWDAEGKISWQRLSVPSIPSAMNHGLLRATGEVVLFLDDDIVPDPHLIEAHRSAHAARDCAVIAGRVIQPWHADGSVAMTGFAATEARDCDEFMGGNFSIRRDFALRLGGFDERFVGVAYRFEAELAARIRCAGGRIRFEPAACLRHLKASAGGTRTFGDHLRSASALHSVGEYYFLLRTRPNGWIVRMLARPWRSVATRHHLKRPWWIAPVLVAEFAGMLWALVLWAQGPKLLFGRT